MPYSVTATAQAYQGGSTTDSKIIGYSYSTIRTVRYQFTTGSDGATSINFEFKGPTTPTGDSTSASINWYVTTSDMSHASAGASATKNGTCSATYDSNKYVWTIGVSNGSVYLLPNTTYYLWLFPNHSSNNHYLTINSEWATSMSITLDGECKPYTLTLNKGSGTNLVVDLYSSPFRDPFSGFSSGATIYTGEVLRVWGSASNSSIYENFVMNVSTVGNVSTGTTVSVTGNITVKTTASVKSFTLSILEATGSTITVNRTSSPLKGASIAKIDYRDPIYYNDVLKIVFSASPGYELVTTTVNGSDFTSGNPHTVTDNVTVATTTKQLGLVYIDNGSGFDAYLIYIDNGSSWEQYAPYLDNGSDWDLLT